MMLMPSWGALIDSSVTDTSNSMTSDELLKTKYHAHNKRQKTNLDPLFIPVFLFLTSPRSRLVRPLPPRAGLISRRPSETGEPCFPPSEPEPV
jgi:hypothetical protein